MAKENKYGIRDLHKEFPNEQKCLEVIFEVRHSRDCFCGGAYSLLKTKQGQTQRKQFQCSKCRNQIAPLSGTIFHKSSTPVTIWLEAALRFSNTKSGYSAKQLERDFNVTYKTAWRMIMVFRKALRQNHDDFMSGDVEMDATKFGGRFKSGKDNKRQKEAIASKSTLLGAVERKKEMRAKVVKDESANVVGDFLHKHINPVSSRLFTDMNHAYKSVARGYSRYVVDHSKKEYARGEAHINTIEGFLGHFKRSTTSTHKVISKKYLRTTLTALFGIMTSAATTGSDFMLCWVR